MNKLATEYCQGINAGHKGPVAIKVMQLLDKHYPDPVALGKPKMGKSAMVTDCAFSIVHTEIRVHMRI